MASVNKVILIGNLGKDPELKTTQSGKSVANFSIATQDGFGDNATTTWHNIVVWEKLADTAAAYLSKGKMVYIEGRIQNRSYDDKDGNKRYITEVVGERMQFLSPRDDVAEEQREKEPEKPARKSRAKKAAQPDVDPETGEELPF